jgi:hypothetical protein
MISKFLKSRAVTSGLSQDRQLLFIRLQVAKMLLEAVIEFKESSVLTVLNNRRNADISKGLIFHSLSLKPANYRSSRMT